MKLRTMKFVGLIVVTMVMPPPLLAEQDPDILAQEAASGADAANPTAAVNFQDLRYRYFDLSRGDKHSFETEGAYMLHPRFKITNELRYVSTDRSGKSEQDFEELKIRGIFLSDIMPFGIKAKLACLRYRCWSRSKVHVLKYGKWSQSAFSLILGKSVLWPQL